MSLSEYTMSFFNVKARKKIELDQKHIAIEKMLVKGLDP
jgi:hypothetical protein